MPVANVPSSLSSGPVHSGSKPSIRPSPSSSLPLSHAVVPVLELPALALPPALVELPPAVALPPAPVELPPLPGFPFSPASLPWPASAPEVVPLVPVRPPEADELPPFEDPASLELDEEQAQLHAPTAMSAESHRID